MLPDFLAGRAVDRKGAAGRRDIETALIDDRRGLEAAGVAGLEDAGRGQMLHIVGRDLTQRGKSLPRIVAIIGQPVGVRRLGYVGVRRAGSAGAAEKLRRGGQDRFGLGDDLGLGRGVDRQGRRARHEGIGAEDIGRHAAILVRCQAADGVDRHGRADDLEELRGGMAGPARLEGRPGKRRRTAASQRPAVAKGASVGIDRRPGRKFRRTLIRQRLACPRQRETAGHGGPHPC